MWEEAAAANSVGGGGVSMPADAVKKKKKKDIYDGRTRAGRKFIERILSRRKAAESKKQVKEDYAQDLDLAQKNMARLAKQEKGQDKKD